VIFLDQLDGQIIEKNDASTMFNWRERDVRILLSLRHFITIIREREHCARGKVQAPSTLAPQHLLSTFGTPVSTKDENKVH
jgi:hypothetical protein